MKFAIIVIVIIIIAMVIKAKYDEYLYRLRVKTEWEYRFGNPPEEEYNDERFQAVSRYHVLTHEGDGVDDITWNDLGMDDIYGVMNQTCCAAGEEFLYHLLRTPLFDQEKLEERSKLTRLFQENENLRIQLQIILSRMGKLYKISLYEYMHKLDDIKIENFWARLFYPLSLVAGVISCLFIPSVGIILLLIFMGNNMFQYFKRKAAIDPYIRVMVLVRRMIGCMEELSSTEVENHGEAEEILSGYISQAKELAKTFSSFVRGSWMLALGKNMGGNLWDSLLDYVRMLFHIDLLQFNKMAAQIKKHNRELEQMFCIAGYLDSMISVSSYQAMFGDMLCKPEFVSSEKKCFHSEQIYHPRIVEPVKNSIYADSCVLLTGANASGKSTFLKTVALNAILAQTIHTVHAGSYKAPFYRIYSSMALRDDLAGNDSYYMVEIKSLKRILDASKEEKVPVLCFVDEVLRGTNTLERIAASSCILQEMSTMNLLCFAATHDGELCSLLSDCYANYHFEEQITEDEVTFDYKLKEGQAMSRNAIRLLVMSGYDKKITDKAEKAANTFLSKGVWEI